LSGLGLGVEIGGLLRPPLLAKNARMGHRLLMMPEKWATRPLNENCADDRLIDTRKNPADEVSDKAEIKIFAAGIEARA
jgi:hypothetical protein